MHWNVVEMMMGERVRHWQKEAERACAVREVRGTKRRKSFKGHEVPAGRAGIPVDRAGGSPSSVDALSAQHRKFGPAPMKR